VRVDPWASLDGYQCKCNTAVRAFLFPYLDFDLVFLKLPVATVMALK
jgi:hypothetical protein